MNKKYFFGIDIGSSSIKALGYCGDKRIFVKKNYVASTPNDYVKTVKKIIDDLIVKTKNNIDAIAFSSQTGTYVINHNYLIKWNEDKGQEELTNILKTTTPSQFKKEIQMKHPFLISYPLPRLLFIKNHHRNAKIVSQLKDEIIYSLTGQFISDFYTWRGLYNFKDNDYSRSLLKKYKLNFVLPKVVSPDKVVGRYRNIKIIVGLNDFYSALIGIGAFNPRTYFDITGTSEHIGHISHRLSDQHISSIYLNHYVTYGVTQSLGPSLNFANCLSSKQLSTISVLKNNPPIFLPYLNGERAPIYDINARGLFFNINQQCQKKELIYSIYEGIAFTLLDILNNDRPSQIIVAGGAANLTLLNEIKANLLGSNILIPQEAEASAFGAYLVACFGLNTKRMKNKIAYRKITYQPKKDTQTLLLKRFKMFKKIYKTNKDNFKLLKETLL